MSLSSRELNELHKLIVEGEYKPIKHILKEAAHLFKCLFYKKNYNR
jgi:hypothetical protein